jgi:hypothetical protein
MFDFLPSYILITCENYITTSANVNSNYQKLLSLVEIGQNVTSLYYYMWLLVICNYIWIFL